MNKEYKLIHSTKSVLFNNELGIAQANGWRALPQTLKSEPDFFSVLVEKEIVDSPVNLLQQKTLLNESASDSWQEMNENYPNSIGHSHGCGCCVCK